MTIIDANIVLRYILDDHDDFEPHDARLRRHFNLNEGILFERIDPIKRVKIRPGLTPVHKIS